jgi:uncharacterized membrane protein YcaP (DUF421 family)
MKPEEINLYDWSRILIGEVPAEFLIEVVIRTTFLYLILLVSMRLIGKRMNSQLTRNELAALVSLAAAIGVPILAPDRGLLPAIIIAIVVVLVNRLVTYVSSKNEKVETLLHGEIDTLVKDSVLQLKTMTRIRITRERIMAQLRMEKIMHLGEVQRLFMEANGNFTLIQNERPEAGLTVLPDEDQEFIKELHANGKLVCKNCGMPNRSGEVNEVCRNCRSQMWVAALERTQEVLA